MTWRLDDLRVRRLLVVGAHADDVELGASGTIQRLVERSTPPEVRWLVLSAEGRRRAEAMTSAAKHLVGVPEQRVEVTAFRERHLPWVAPRLKAHLDAVAAWAPDLVLCPRRADRHQDHATVGELVWQTFRGTTIWEYEIAKWEGDLATPNLYVPLEARHADRKVDLLVSCFPSQHHRDWFDEATFRALMRLRAVECRAPSGAAEGFHVAKTVAA